MPILAPADVLRERNRAEYGPFVTPSLLSAWLRDPSAAPGRAVSSPWPERIEVRSVRRTGAGRYEVEGDVVYVTSVERACGGEAGRERAVVEVVRGEEGGWRIGSYHVPHR